MSEQLLVEVAVGVVGGVAGEQAFGMLALSDAVGSGGVKKRDGLLMVAGPIVGASLALRYGLGVPFGSRMVLPIAGAIAVGMVL